MYNDYDQEDKLTRSRNRVSWFFNGITVQKFFSHLVYRVPRYFPTNIGNFLHSSFGIHTFLFRTERTIKMAANSKIILHDVDFRETKNAHCFEVHSFLFLEFLRIREFKGKIARERIIKMAANSKIILDDIGFCETKYTFFSFFQIFKNTKI